MSKRSSLRNQSAVFILLFAGILILVNLVSLRFFGRADLTRDNMFTLSGASVNMMSNLDDRLVVKAYFTKNLPGRFASLERQVRDLLDEYSQHSGGMMTLEFIDPTGDDEAEETAKALGIRKMPNPDIEKDQTTIKEGYRGISFSYGQNTEVIAAVRSAVGLEYEIAMTLKKVLGTRSSLGFITGHGEPQIEPPNDTGKPLLPEQKMARGAYRNVRTNLKIYNYIQVDMKQGEIDIAPEIDAVVIAGANTAYTDKDLYRLDQFLLRGKSVAIFLSGLDVKVTPPEYPGMPPAYEVHENKAGLRDFLKHHGIDIGLSMVFDKQSSRYTAKCPPLPIPLPRPYPAWPMITAFDEDHPVSFRLGSLTIPYGSPVHVTKQAAKDPKKDAREIAFSSGNTWIAGKEEAIVDPCGVIKTSNFESGVPMAAAISGDFSSYFKGKKLPVELDAQDALGAFVEESQAKGRLIVVGSAAVPQDESIIYLARMDNRQASNNFTFVQNILDWMTSEEDLIKVRMKTVDDPPLDKGSESAKMMAKWINIIGVPFALILFGLIRWRLRATGRRSKERPKKNAGGKDK